MLSYFINFKRMKKLILFFIVVLLVSCSKDDNGASSNSDPLIGNWLNSESDLNNTYNFKSNGRFTTTEEVCTFDGVELPSDLFWAANEENPDFTQVRREYRFTVTCDDRDETIIVSANFSDDFNTVYFVETDFRGVRQ